MKSLYLYGPFVVIVILVFLTANLYGNPLFYLFIFFIFFLLYQFFAPAKFDILEEDDDRLFITYYSGDKFLRSIVSSGFKNEVYRKKYIPRFYFHYLKGKYDKFKG